MPSSPRPPNRRRRSSGASSVLSLSTPQTNGYSLTRPPHSRKSSLTSVQSSSTPRPISSHSHYGDFGPLNGFGSAGDSGNGLGNLADELAEAWDEEGEEAPSEVQTAQNGILTNDNKTPSMSPQLEMNDSMSYGVASSPLPQQYAHSVPPTKQCSRTKYRRKTAQHDGSDYGSDLEEIEGISASLEARMAAIEHLARRGTEANGSQADTVIQRVAESLKDLGSQAGVENGASRLITAHTSLTTHIDHTTRTLTALIASLLSPLAIPPDPTDVDELLPLLPDVLSSLPTPNPLNTSSLRALTASTADILSHLSTLSDTLHMTRQTSALASRRLQSTKAMIVELRREHELGEEGRRWIEMGGWERRLREREGARVCGEVVGGFDRFCEGWKVRLMEGAVGIGAA